MTNVRCTFIIIDNNNKRKLPLFYLFRRFHL
nr:MAG TPA: hypothetical protein [Bacteriophage sp.]